MKNIFLFLAIIPAFVFGQFNLEQIKTNIENINLSVSNIKALAFSEDEKLLFIGSLTNSKQLIITIYDINKKRVIANANTSILGFKDLRPSPSGKQILIRSTDGFNFQLQLIPDINNLNRIIPVNKDISGNLFEIDYCWQNENVFESSLGVFDIEKWQNTNIKSRDFPWNGNVNDYYYLKVTDLCQSVKHDAQGSEITVFNRSNNYREKKVLVRTLCNAQAISYTGKYVAYLGDNYQLKLLTINIDNSIKENLYCVEIPNYESYPDETIATLQKLISNNQLVTGNVIRAKIHPITNKPIEPDINTQLDVKDFLVNVQFTELKGNILYFKVIEKYVNDYNIQEGDYLLGAFTEDNLNTNEFKKLNDRDLIFGTTKNEFRWISKVQTNCNPKFLERNINSDTKNKSNENQSEINTDQSNSQYVSKAIDTHNELKLVEPNISFDMKAGEKVKYFLPPHKTVKYHTDEIGGYTIKVTDLNNPKAWYYYTDGNFFNMGTGKISTDAYYVIKAETNVKNLRIELLDISVLKQ